MSERLGAVNGYNCQTCGWATLTINLNHGTTPMFIGCRGDQTKNPNAPENIVIGEHRCSSNMYQPQNWWLTKKSPALCIEHAWIRPTGRWLLEWIKKQNVPKGDDPMAFLVPMLDHVTRGGLMLVMLDEHWENAPIIKDYHKEGVNVISRLNKYYADLIKKANKYYERSNG